MYTWPVDCPQNLYSELYNNELFIFIFTKDLIKDLQIAKKQSWEEKERLSAQYEEDRKLNLAKKVRNELQLV